MPLKVTDDQVRAVLASGLNQSEAAKVLGVHRSNISRRLPKLGMADRMEAHPSRIVHEIEDGTVIVGSDAHVWPGPLTTAQRAFLYMIAELRPTGVVLNGDGLDGARIKRHPPIGWERLPTVEDEFKALGDFLGQIEDVAGEAWLDWPLGNHDKRFETWFASRTPEMACIQGVHLRDHFPNWAPCWSAWINPGTGRSPVCIKHRFKGGVHATHVNTLHAGITMVTGHDHMLKATSFSDYWGTRWGISTGMLAAPYTGQFTDYTEDGPVNWQSGFQVLTFRGGKLTWPETVFVADEAAGLIHFRGEVIHV